MITKLLKLAVAFLFISALVLPRSTYAVISTDLFFTAPKYFLDAIRPVEVSATNAKTEPDQPINFGRKVADEYLNILASVSKDGHKAVRVMREIIRRESGWKWWLCNLTTVHGCKAGQGLTQVIPSTEAVCEANFKREMDMIDLYDNLDCAWWLLTDRGVRSGIGHWDDFSWRRGEPKRWGSGPYFLEKFGY